MATDLETSVAELIVNTNIISDVINEDGTTEVSTSNGPIPSLRKALADNLYFQDPIPWSNGTNETEFNQLRTFTDGTVWWSPSATTVNPVPMGATPVGDSNWYPFQDRNLRNTILGEVTRFNIKGTFAAGFVYETTDDVGLDNSGNPWTYTGSLPFTVPAGTTPTSPAYTEESFSDHNATMNRSALGAHDDIYNRQIDGLKNAAALIQSLSIGDTFETKGFYAGKQYGGIKYRVVSEPASSHFTVDKNVIYIALNAIIAWDGTQANLTQLLNWTADSSSVCIAFEYKNSDASHFGGIIDDMTVDNTVCANRSMDTLGYVKIPESETPFTINTPINVGGEYQVKFISDVATDSAFDSSQPLDEQEYPAKIYAPNGLTTNATDDRCRVFVNGLLVYGSGRGLGQTCIQGRTALYVDNSAILEYNKLTENDFAFLSYINRSRFDRLNWFAHIATANGFYIRDCFFGSTIQRVIDTEELTLGTGAVSTGFPICIERCNINCGTNTQFIARTRGGFTFNENYVECFSDTAGASLFLHRAGRFDNGFWEMGYGNEINAQNHTANLVEFYGDNAAGTQNFRGRVGAQNRIFGFTSSTPVVVGAANSLFPSASTEVAYVDVEYPIGVDRRGNFNNYHGNFTCVDGASVDFSSSSFVTLPLTQTYPSDTTDAISSGNTWAKRRGGVYDIEVELSVQSSTVQRNMEMAIFVNGTQTKRVRASITPATSEAGNYFDTVYFSAPTLALARGDDVQIRARNGGIGYITQLAARRIDD